VLEVLGAANLEQAGHEAGLAQIESAVLCILDKRTTRGLAHIVGVERWRHQTPMVTLDGLGEKLTDVDSAKSPAPRWERRSRLVDEVADELRARIYDGQYSAGTVIHQENLSLELGISRTPLREAIRMLEQEGLLVAEPGRAARVVSGSRKTLLDAYELRSVIDGLAARLATKEITESQIEELQTVMSQQEASLEPWVPAEYTRLNIRFHELIIQSTGNQFLIAELVLLRMTAQIFNPFVGVSKSVAVNAVQQHHQILDAITDRDPQRAELLARGHIETTLGRLREQDDQD
jgi:DNA-binding GntR family transcriptional regulator